MSATAHRHTTAGHSAARPPQRGRAAAPYLLPAAIAATLVGAALSMFIGVADVNLGNVFTSEGWFLVSVSRLPRTLALLLVGSALAVVGLIMQMLARNKFVEPSTAGTVESVSLGLLVVAVFAPTAPLIAKMGFGALFGLGGTALFLAILARISLRNILIVPLLGIMLGGIISSITTFFAYRLDLIQSLGAWTTGDFSGVLQGRYEMLYVVGGLTVIAYLMADRFTVAGLGSEFTTNLGLHYGRVILAGLVLVSVVTAVIVVSVGAVPFVGLIIPNLVSLLIGDNVRRGLPWVAVFGAAFVLLCDVLSRVINYPYEVPIGTVMGVLGGVVFIAMILRRTKASS
ncbi:iron chelate uptake ABC transporter family permease subunit [Micrococcales bacterium 31B]|nr:iron chelate uptake ABC transporter family permease subunit [Micrococcales bacterium 31B]